MTTLNTPKNSFCLGKCLIDKKSLWEAENAHRYDDFILFYGLENISFAPLSHRKVIYSRHFPSPGESFPLAHIKIQLKSELSPIKKAFNTSSA
jgi:hypothetical protein